MSFKPAECQDEHGVTFIVYEDDPAWAYVYRLTSHGAQYVVLPRTAYITGDLGPAPKTPALSKLDASERGAATLVKRYVRLLDAYHWLTKDADES